LQYQGETEMSGGDLVGILMVGKQL